MTNEFIVNHLTSNNHTLANEKSLFSVDQNGLNTKAHHLPEILFITSFPPRECGIATYSQDLINALNLQYENSFTSTICALESEAEQHNYVQAPKFILNTDKSNSFVKLAFQINKDEQIKLVVIQHEFGFFAAKESEFKELINTITKPIVIVFHTVLSNPNLALKAKVDEMLAIASSIIVMTNDAAKLLKKEYNAAEKMISVIPHGTHLVHPLNSENLKKQYQLSGKMVLSTFGLLGKSKSIETTLNALPSIIAKFPNVLFLVLGKTHPGVIKQDGEQYRNSLQAKVHELKLENHVRFVNEYLSLPKLLEYLQLSDIYLFTSKDPNQAVSGTFSYAVSCGCPVISTPIPHAKEVLGKTNGIIIDFENSLQLTEAVLHLLENKNLRTEISTNSFHKMASTAWQNSAIAHALVFDQLSAGTIYLQYKNPPILLKHIKNMTTRLGMIQFSKIAHPDIHSGYTLDDNARALIAICQHFEMYKNENDLFFIETYLHFIKQCMQADGKFLNYMNEQRTFTAQNYNENLEDSNGRAIWALGYVSSLTNILPAYLTNESDFLVRSALPHLSKIHSTRAMAFIIKGLHYHNDTENLTLLKTFADRMVQMYEHEKTNDWHWFENYLTYGNSLLPEAMLCAYLSTQNEQYKAIAIESFDFLLSKIMLNGKLKVVSNKGWLTKGVIKENILGGEQPIDVAYTVIALEKFYTVLEDDTYKHKATIAFNWFMGDNHLHQIVYNPCTGGCYDGVEEFNVNINQGAESTISYLMARLAMERLSSETISPFHFSNKELTITAKPFNKQHELSIIN